MLAIYKSNKKYILKMRSNIIDLKKYILKKFI
jgi:hypothetical protein